MPEVLFTSGGLLLFALLLDRVWGDPVYLLHPVRLLGHLARLLEQGLFQLGWKGRLGGLLQLLALIGLSLPPLLWLRESLTKASPWLGWGFELWLLYSLLAFGDLLKHGKQVLRAIKAKDLAQLRQEAGKLVSRDLRKADEAACLRATLESLAENFVDGFVSPLLAYLFFGLPGLWIFKVFSTLDSMVGYKTERYRRFGWAAAKGDDLLNWLPARLGWLGLVLAAALTPGVSGKKAWVCGWRQHRRHASPNSGWPMATVAGALGLRLGGPVARGGSLRQEAEYGFHNDPFGAKPSDLTRLFRLLNWAWAGAFALQTLKIAFMG